MQFILWLKNNPSAAANIRIAVDHVPVWSCVQAGWSKCTHTRTHTLMHTLALAHAGTVCGYGAVEVGRSRRTM